MKCQFCQEDMTYVPLETVPVKNKIGAIIESSRTLRVYYCYDCKAEYVQFAIGGSITLHLYTTINGKMYRWTQRPIIDEVSGHLYYIEEPGEPGIRPNRKAKMLKSFKTDIPEITPSNIEDKIKLILMFM